MVEHIVTTFDSDFSKLRSLLSQMGGMIETQITTAIEALTHSDDDRAQKVISLDKDVDRLEQEAERFAIEMIALRSPVADDLREIISALKLTAIYERIGDCCRNIARRSIALSQTSQTGPGVVLPEMGWLVHSMIKEALDAHAARDEKKARAVWIRDKDIDEFYNCLFRSLLTHMMENPRQITLSTHLLFIAKNFERIGDHATSIAEMTYYNVTGKWIEEIRPKGHETNFSIIHDYKS